MKALQNTPAPYNSPIRTREDEPRGIRWTLFSSLEDLDFADDPALLSHTHRHIQEERTRLSTLGQQVGLKISQTKTELMTVGLPSASPVEIGQSELTSAETFWAACIISQDRGNDKDMIQNRLNKFRNVFMSMTAVWKSDQYSTKTKLRIYRSCVLSTLLYGSECWRMTEHGMSKLSSFHTTSLMKTLMIFWPRTISTTETCWRRPTKRTCARSPPGGAGGGLATLLRKDSGSITKIAVRWTPEGKRKRGRPKIYIYIIVLTPSQPRRSIRATATRRQHGAELWSQS